MLLLVLVALVTVNLALRAARGGRRTDPLQRAKSVIAPLVWLTGVRG